MYEIYGSQLQVKLVKTIPENVKDSSGLMASKTEIVIKVDNFEDGYYYQWSDEKFQDRLFMLRDLVNEYFDSGILPQLQQEDDPLWDPPEPQIIG